MTTIYDVPVDLLAEILSRVPITCLKAVRCTCKQWDALSKDEILCKAEASQELIGFMMKEYKMCSMRFNLHGIHSEVLVNPSIREIHHSLLDQVDVSEMFQCDGLLLYLTKEDDYLKSRTPMVWNPYLGQTKCIQPRNTYHILDRYAIGYESNKNRNHKILRYLDTRFIIEYEIYDFGSNSWRGLDVTPYWEIDFVQRGVSLKGNAYFFAKERIEFGPGPGPFEVDETVQFLLSFDFTTERFGKLLPLPFEHYFGDTGTMSSLRDEKLAALHQGEYSSEVEIWVTTKIEPNAVSWIPFLKVDIEPFTGRGFQFCHIASSFFVDEVKKLVIVFDMLYYPDRMTRSGCYLTAYIIGEKGYMNKINLGEAVNRYMPVSEPQFCFPLVCSYVPSLVQINQTIPADYKLDR